MTAHFTDEEKRAFLAKLQSEIARQGDEGHLDLDETEAEIVKAIAADYHTKIAGIQSDDGLANFRKAVEAGHDTSAAMASGFTPVVSSNIAAMKYNPSFGGELYVRFRNGTAYLYYDVTRELYDTVLRADSVGSAFYKYLIKDRHESEKLENWK